MSRPVYLVSNSKGGVGKSLVSMALVDFLLSREEEVLVIETDDSNPDVFKAYEGSGEAECEVLSLDDANGWIDLADLCEAEKERTVVINGAARSIRSICDHGETLGISLEELKRPLVTLWVINTKRDSLELLSRFMETLPEAQVHVIRNLYWGDEGRFGLYNDSNLRKKVEERGGRTVNLGKVAERVTAVLSNDRMTLREASTKLTIGTRAEVKRWQKVCARMFGELVDG